MKGDDGIRGRDGFDGFLGFLGFFVSSYACGISLVFILISFVFKYLRSERCWYCSKIFSVVGLI